MCVESFYSHDIRQISVNLKPYVNYTKADTWIPHVFSLHDLRMFHKCFVIFQLRHDVCRTFSEGFHKVWAVPTSGESSGKVLHNVS